MAHCYETDKTQSKYHNSQWLINFWSKHSYDGHHSDIASSIKMDLTHISDIHVMFVMVAESDP